VSLIFWACSRSFWRSSLLWRSLGFMTESSKYSAKISFTYSTRSSCQTERRLVASYYSAGAWKYGWWRQRGAPAACCCLAHAHVLKEFPSSIASMDTRVSSILPKRLTLPLPAFPTRGRYPWPGTCAELPHTLLHQRGHLPLGVSKQTGMLLHAEDLVLQQ
jgi:hypothetical protein